MRKFTNYVLGAACCLAATAFLVSCSAAGTGGGSGETQAKTGESQAKAEETKETAGDQSVKGTKITVMVPPWGEPSKELLDSFMKDTGIDVTINVVGWDDIRDKVSIAAVGKKAPADVFEVDWSWVGEFGAADWLEPIPMTDEEKAGMPVVSSFQYRGQTLALPYANDFRLGYYNKDYFSKIGMSQAPDNWDDMVAACKKLKAAGVCEYPIPFALSATEGTTTCLLWYTESRYGAFFNDDFTVNKEHVLAALQSLDQLVNQDKLINPADENLKDVEVYPNITSGSAAFMVGPTSYIGKINNPKYSSVIGQVSPILVPGNATQRTASFALPEGVGVSKFSKNKAAAMKYIQWFTSPDVQVQIYKDKNSIPTRTEALQKLIDDGAIQDGQVLIEQSKSIVSPFPGGIPSWYSEMSNAIYNSVNQMVTGGLTPEQAVTKISDKVNELNK